MAIFEVAPDGINALKPTTFNANQITERGDLQRLLRDRIGVIDADLLVIAEEFGSFENSKRRIDLLAIDRSANFVVIELKRGETGGHMDLQAIRYAAMVSAMTFNQAVQAHEKYLKDRQIDGDSQQAILDFLGWEEPAEDEFGQDVRVVLVAADFSNELMTSVMWLNERDLDIRCVRLRPYQLEARVLLDVQQVMPLPEAADFQIRVREKQRKEREDKKSSRDLTKFDVTINGKVFGNLPKRRTAYKIIRALCDAGVTPEQIHAKLPWRVGNLWRVADGELGSDEFVLAATEAAENGGPAFELRRWYADDEHLIVSGGRTWALNKGWGRRSEEAFEILIKTFAGRGVECCRTSSDDD